MKTLHRYTAAKLMACAALMVLAGVLVPAYGVATEQLQPSAQEDLLLDMEVIDQGVSLKLHNTSARAISLLTWGTPFGRGLDASVFQVRDVGIAAPAGFDLTYKGLLMKRGQPRRDDFITIASGGVLNVDIVLSDYYEVDVVSQYQVQYIGSFKYSVDIDSWFNETQDLSAAQTAEKNVFGGVLSVYKPDLAALELTLQVPPETRAALVPAFASCSVSQQAELATALQSAETITRNAVIALGSLEVRQRSSSPRYTKWFGRYSEARFNRVYSGFSTMQSVLENSTIGFVCGCARANTFAFVNRSKPFEINLCPSFWSAPLFGSDSRSGTIVHELSHFSEILGTSDFQYGASLVSKLAAEDPDRAVLNADSYEYFAENQPEIPIAGTDTGLTSGVEFLPLDVVTSGTLGEAQSAYFSVSAAESVELTSVGGDADLYVYRAVSDENVFCESVTTGVVDACPVGSLSSAVVRVYAYSASTYQIVARSTVRVTGQGGSAGGGGNGGSISIWFLLAAFAGLHIRRSVNGKLRVRKASEK